MKQHFPPSHQSGSRLKLTATIAVALLLLTTVISCQKTTDVTTNPGQAGTRNNARTLTGTDSTEIVTDLKDFFDYADERSHGLTGSAGGLSSTLSDEAANDLMEATLNYYFGLMGDDLDDSQWYTDSITISLNGSSTLDIADVADGYNDALTQIKTDFASVGSVSCKRLEMVDVEVVNAGSNRIFAFRYKIGWNPVNWGSWTAYSYNVPFSSVEGDLFWKDAGSSCIYKSLGAPGNMCRNIKNYFNRFPGWAGVSTRDRSIPINIVHDDITGASTTTSNPFAAAHPLVMVNYWSHYWAEGLTSDLNMVTCIPTNGLNAYRSAIIAYIQARQTALNKEFSNIELWGNQYGTQPPRRIWDGKYYFANFISGEQLLNLE